MNGHRIGYHIVLRLVDDRVLAPDTAARRRLAATVMRVGKALGLLAFGAADTHLHVLTVADRAEAGKLAHALELALRHALGLSVGFAAARIRPIEDQRHLQNAFRYVHTNAAHHGVLDPEASEATSLHDLLGLRVGGGWLAVRVQRHLPRVDRAALVAMLDLPELPTRATASFDPADADLVAAVLSLPELPPAGRLRASARRAMLEVLGASARPSYLASALGMSERGLRKLRTYEPNPEVVEALHRQMAWRVTLAGTRSNVRRLDAQSRMAEA